MMPETPRPPDPIDPPAAPTTVLVRQDPETLLEEIRLLEQQIADEEDQLTTLHNQSTTQRKKVSDMLMELRRKLRGADAVLPLFDATLPPPTGAAPADGFDD